MAEPIIISYARGLLREFPGVPEGIVDVIPVDLVVAAIIAAAARGPSPERPGASYHVASGVRNPLAYGGWNSSSRNGSDATRSTTSGGSRSPSRSGPSPGAAASSASSAGPPGSWTAPSAPCVRCRYEGEQASWSAKLEDRHNLAERALGYVELYGAYTETEARYRVDRLMALWETLGRGRSANLRL